MVTAAQLLREGRRDEVWRKYCGFIDLSLKEFMQVQKRLLLEQIQVLGSCELGRKLMRGQVPRSVEEFRAMVPLTTYDDYAPYLPEKRGDVLPRPPYVWVRTSGRSGEYECKWAPYPREFYEKVSEFMITSFIFASCAGRGDVRLEPGDTCLYTLAPPPYMTGGLLGRGLQEQLEVRMLPPMGEGDTMGFQERVEAGFKMALDAGIDLFYGLSSVLVGVAEQFQSRSGRTMKLSADYLKPNALLRLGRGFLNSRRQGRALLPKDLWSVKGIVAGGMDTAFFASRIEEYWGCKPLEGYGGSEFGGVAVQLWNRKGMTFLADCNFLEFIPETEFLRTCEDPTYRPSTLLLDELSPGIYELVVTNFHGGIFTRYRIGDLIEIIALRDDELGVDIPQMQFYARADGLIDLGGFTRLTEKALWQVFTDSGIPYADWTARKEYVGDKPVLHAYVELKEGATTSLEEVTQSLHTALSNLDPGYAEMKPMLGIDPLKVTLLPPGSFGRYIKKKQEQGAELAHLKPPRVNARDTVVETLLSA